MFVPMDHAVEAILSPFYAAWKEAFRTPGALPLTATGERHVGAEASDRKVFIDFVPGLRLPDLLAETTERLFDYLAAFSATCIREFERASGSSRPTDLMGISGGRERAVLRITHYPSAFREVVGNAHADIDLLTLLPPATARGLQILGDDGWREMDVPNDAVLVLSGEILEILGGPPAVVHRVVSPGAERISASFFLNARPDLLLPSGDAVANIMKMRIEEIRAPR